MNYKSFYDLPRLTTGVGNADIQHYERLNTLGFINANQRIANIMQAGQQLQEARENQYSYVGKNLRDLNSHLKDFDPPPTYADKFETADAVKRLSDKERAVRASKIVALAKNASVDKTIQDNPDDNKTSEPPAQKS